MEFHKIVIKIFWAYIIFILLSNTNKSIIYIKEENKITEYEQNIDFSNLTSTIKVIALYLPQFHVIEENNKFWGEGFTEWTNVKKSKQRFEGHHQPRIPGDEYGYLGYYDLTNIKTIENQVKLAKSHGIYGFGIYYYWFSGKKILKKPINLFIKHSYIDFHFLLIWANENWSKRWDGKDKEILIKQEYKSDDPIKFIKDIKKYVRAKRYIKIDKKPVLGLYEPSKIPNIKKTIKIWRRKSIELGIGEIFILISINRNKTMDFQNLNLFNASYEFPPRNSFQNNRILKKNTLIYSELLYKSSNLNDSSANFKKFPFFRGAVVEWDNSPRIKECEIFEHYSPEQFFMFNKIIVDWTLKHYNKDLRFIFINAWNEWGEGSYLEPDNKYGYSSINSLSRAIFNLSYIEITNSIGTNRIAVLLYINDEDSIKDILNKTNNIPYIYDLYIYINNEIDSDDLNHYIKSNSKANYFELELFFNQKENILDLFSKFRNKAKNYKYICNMNSKKYKDINYFIEWKNYIYNNLLGNSEIISEIITDFEKNVKLGLIFPEKYYKSLVKFGDNINDFEIKYLNFIIRKIFPDNKVKQNYVIFPEGNMFWAKVKAIYQVFNLYSNVIRTIKSIIILNDYIELIWVFLVNLNGFLYKTIFKHL